MDSLDEVGIAVEHKQVLPSLGYLNPLTLESVVWMSE